MLFEEAKVLVSEGKAVRRKSWAKDHFVTATGSNFSSTDDGGASGSWSPVNEDATAQDWEEVPQSKVLAYQTKVAKGQEKEQTKQQKEVEKANKQLLKDQAKAEKDKAKNAKAEERRLKAAANNATQQ